MIFFIVNKFQRCSIKCDMGQYACVNIYVI